jgi:hypothetical protein
MPARTLTPERMIEKLRIEAEAPETKPFWDKVRQDGTPAEDVIKIIIGQGAEYGCSPDVLNAYNELLHHPKVIEGINGLLGRY